MPLQTPVGFGIAAWHFEGGDGTPEYITTCGVNFGAGTFPSVAICNSLMDAYGDAFAALTSNDVALVKVSVSVGTDEERASVQSTNGSYSGTRVSDSGLMSAAPICQKVTGGLGRKNRGRMFLPALLTQSDIFANGGLPGDLRGDIQDAADTFFTNATTGTDPVDALVVLHNDPADAPTDITSFRISEKLGIIRGRT